MIHDCPRVDSRHRSRFQHHHNPAAEPSPAARSVGGLLSDIQSTIMQQPFTDSYSIIPGKELGRHVPSNFTQLLHPYVPHDWSPAVRTTADT
ncbi:hypothetical protein D4764_17G0009200 [Takifugu flavidus]|uniref:Uncharacterized protein n=1 Tax=Takifugu flavidus TaxID=433684 RepID=A0A5C6P048_9TELE|nr:hypothetical protein D4764_17G0009200 [Takifugu flavidus]